MSGSTISVNTDIAMNAGDTVAGWIALYTTDYPPHNSDRAYVALSNGEGVAYQPIQVTVVEAWGDDWDTPTGAEPHSAPWTYWSWTYWSWTAPVSGVYTLSLSNYMYDQEASIAGFDGIELHHHAISEPGAFLLLDVSFVGLIGIKKLRIAASSK